MNTSYTANTTGGKVAPGLALTAASPSNYNNYSNLDEGNLDFLLQDFNPINASPFTQTFGSATNALGIDMPNDRFAPSEGAVPVFPTQNAGELDFEAFIAAAAQHQTLPAPVTQTQTGSHLYSSGSSESLSSSYISPTPVDILSGAYARSNSGSPSPSHTPSTTTPSQRGYSLSPQTQSLPPTAFHNFSSNTISPIQLHSPSHSRTNSLAHSRKLSTQSIRDITEGMQTHVQIGQPFTYPVTPQDAPVALPRIAGHRIQHGHHRSRSIPMLHPLNTVDQVETTHSAPVYLPTQQQYQYQHQHQYQDQLAAVAYQQNPQYLSAVPASFSKPYAQHSDFEDGASPASGAEESGSSMYSPMVSYGHSRNPSTSTSAGSPFGNQQNLSPLSRGGSVGAVATPSAHYTAGNGVSADLSIYGFSPVTQGSDAHDPSAPLKRKRSTESELEEYDDEDGDASYDGGSPSADDDDTDYSDDSDRKGKGRNNFKKGHGRRPSKRQNCISGDWDLSALGDSSYNASTSPTQTKSRRSGSGSPTQQRRLPRKAPKLPEGANIKVAALPPIQKTDKCCPICFHVPGNGRYSDLMRHAKTHLNVPEHYVCITCSVVERSNVDGLLEFVEGEVFTRKDSCRRHWNAKHNPTGQLKWEEKFCLVVDRVRKVGDASASPSSANGSSITNVSNVPYVSYIPNMSNMPYSF